MSTHNLASLIVCPFAKWSFLAQWRAAARTPCLTLSGMMKLNAVCMGFWKLINIYIYAMSCESYVTWVTNLYLFYLYFFHLMYILIFLRRFQFRWLEIAVFRAFPVSAARKWFHTRDPICWEWSRRWTNAKFQTSSGGRICFPARLRRKTKRRGWNNSYWWTLIILWYHVRLKTVFAFKFRH